MPDPLHPTIITPTPRRRQERKVTMMKVTAAFLLVVFLTVSLHGNWRLALGLLCICAALWWLRNVWRHYREREELLADVDAMSAEEVSRYIGELLRVQGYSVSTRGKRGGPVADLLLSRGKEDFACWIQHSGRSTDAEMIAKAAAAVQAHPRWRAMVVSSRSCSLNVYSLARREGCILIHRSGLANMVAQYRSGHRVITFPFEEKARLRGRK
ncbi:MAG: restriction endonuclease [Candidatus Binatia bacterium]